MAAGRWWRGVFFASGSAGVGCAGRGVDPTRGYADVATMLAAEAQRADGVEAVAIMTPNDTHYPTWRRRWTPGWMSLATSR